MVKLRTLCESYLKEHFWLGWSTRQTTERAFRYFALCSGNLTCDRLRFEHISEFKGWLVRTGRSRTTANIYLRSLKPVFGWAVNRRIIKDNPATEIREFKVTQRPIRIYEDWEFQRMLRYAPSAVWRLILIIGRTTGLRRGAILNLTRNNIRQGFIFVEPKKDTNHTWAWEPKDREIRKVPLIEGLGTLIEKDRASNYITIPHRRYRYLMGLKSAGMLNERMRICPLDNFRRTFVAIQRKAFGRQVGTFHDLRKTYATEMASSLPDYFTARLLGHSNVSTLVTYYTATKDSQYLQARQIAENAIKGTTVGSQSVFEGAASAVPRMGDTELESVTSCV